MKVREHIWVASRCVACGAQDWAAICRIAITAGKGVISGPDERQCIEREDYIVALCPEPARRHPACEDTDTIAARIADLYRERTEAMNQETA